jgi:TetR/AcrR family transcriptional regulator, repressor for neighboring sulfatase
MVLPVLRDDTQPHGEQEVKEAVLVAAARLFAEKGPTATSVREIASAAQVNHGLIHRHFGTKRQLVRAVHDHLADRLTAGGPFREASLDSALRAFHTLEEDRTYWTVLTRAMLDGELDEVLSSELPGARQMVQTLEDALPAGTPIGAPDLVAMGLAFSLGWLLLRDFIQAATGGGDDVPEQWFSVMASILEPR